MRKLQNKYGRPRTIWNTALIAEDKAIFSEYGLRRKKEIWAIRAMVSDFRRRARELNAVRDKEKESILVEKINKLGYIKVTSLDDILSIQIKDILNRRLQTIVFRKGMAKTPNQARQFIVHGHVTVDGKKTTFPSYIVPLTEEDKISIGVDLEAANPSEKAVAAKQGKAEETGSPTKSEDTDPKQSAKTDANNPAGEAKA